MSWLACQGGCDVANHVANGNRKFKLSLSHHGNIQQGQKSIQTDKHHLVSEYVDWAFIQDTLSFSVPTPEATNQNTYKGISGSSDTMRSLGVAGGLTLVTSVVDPSIWSETTRWTKSFRGPQLIPAMTGHLWCDLLRRALHLRAFTPYGYNFQPTTVQ